MSSKKKGKSKKNIEAEQEAELTKEPEEASEVEPEKPVKKKKKNKEKKDKELKIEDKEEKEEAVKEQSGDIGKEKKITKEARSDSEEERPKFEVPDEHPKERPAQPINIVVSPLVSVPAIISEAPAAQSTVTALQLASPSIVVAENRNEYPPHETKSLIVSEKVGDSPALRSRKTQLFVTKYPYNTTQEDLTDYFSNFGDIKDLYMKRGGYAFIDYFNADASERAIKNTTILMRGMLPLVEIALDRAQMENLRGKGSRPPRADEDCWVCKERGHYSYECPFKTRRGGSSIGGRGPFSNYPSDRPRYRERSREKDFNAIPPRDDRDYGYLPKRSYYDDSSRQAEYSRDRYHSSSRYERDYRYTDGGKPDLEESSSSFVRDYLPRARDASPYRPQSLHSSSSSQQYDPSSGRSTQVQSFIKRPPSPDYRPWGEAPLNDGQASANMHYPYPGDFGSSDGVNQAYQTTPSNWTNQPSPFYN